METKGGFTLIELMIVVAIIAILAAVALPAMGESIRKAKDSNGIKVLGAIRTASGLYSTDDVNVNGDGIFFALNIKDIEIYLTPAMKKNLKYGDETTSATDNITSYQIVCGKVVNGSTVSVGRGELAGRNNVVEIYYNNQDGSVYADGTNEGDGYTDTKERLWKEY